jgi:pimeloyl-ACP methyl ester carboxylesterase
LDLIESLRMSLNWTRVFLSFLLWSLVTKPRHSRGRRDAGDISIFFRRFGSGEPIVLLHGGLAFAEFWAGQFPALSRHGLVIAPDSRGHGRSTLGNEPMTYRQLALDFTRLLDGLELGPAHLVGWSDGGCASIGMALERPDLVRSITLIGAPFNVDNYTPDAKLKMQKFLRPTSINLLGLRLMWRLLTPEPDEWGVFLERLSRMWLELPDYTVEELGRITAPTLVIACDHDEFFSLGDDPLAVFRETADAIPNSRMVVVPGGTHGVQMQHPRKVNGLIIDFITRLNS